MKCAACNRELVPVLWRDDSPIAWICGCLVQGQMEPGGNYWATMTHAATWGIYEDKLHRAGRDVDTAGASGAGGAAG